MKLNLGCDKDKRDGWINLDCYDNPNADVIHDLNQYPWPFKDNEFDYVLARWVIEHLDNPLRAMKEIWRISKPDAIIEIGVPYWTHCYSWVDITHKRPFVYDSFSSLCGFVHSNKDLQNGYIPKLFEYEERKLIWGITEKPILKYIAKFMNWLVNLCPLFVEHRIPFLIPIEFLYIKLRALK